MYNLWPAEKRFIARGAWVVCLALAVGHALPCAGSALTCESLFADSTDQWPPSDWGTFLKRFPESKQERPLVEHFPSQSTTEPTIYDARFYTLHRYLHLFPAKEMQKLENPIPELELPESNYIYLGGFNRDRMRSNSVKGPFGNFVVVQSKSSGIKMTIPGLRPRPKGRRADAFVRALNSYLSNLEQIVDRDERDPKLDYFFSTLDSLGSEKRIDPQQVLRDEAWKDIASARSAAANGDSRTEAVVTATYDEGDTQRIATRTTFKRGRVWVTVQDSHIQRNRVSIHKELPPSDFEIQEGRTRQREWLDQVVSILYPDYVSRRKWTKAFIQSDYREVLESADRTRYIIVQADDGNGNPGKILASIGLNRAPYSSFTTVVDSSKGWTKFLMAGGYHFMRDFTNAGYSDKSFKAGKLPMHDLPVLKMENYLGVHLERPVATDQIVWNVPANAENGRVEFDLPSHHGEGIIYEPVKFYLTSSAELGSTPLTELVSVMAESLFPDYHDPLFSLTGQWLYTFNPLREGQLLYAKRGYKTDPHYQSVVKDGAEWHIFGQSPGEFLEKFHKLSEADQQIAAGAFLRSLQETANNLSKQRTPEARQ